MTTRYDLCEEDARKILIHEMVHMWEWVNGYKCGHLTSFKMKAAEINRKTANKYKIARFTDLSSNSPLSAKHRAKPVDELPDSTGIIITYDCGCGRRLIKSTPNNYNELIDKLKCYGYTMNDIHIYKCKGQIISTYCKSVKKIHKYFLSTDTFENKIKPTIINEIKYKTAA